MATLSKGALAARELLANGFYWNFAAMPNSHNSGFTVFKISAYGYRHTTDCRTFDTWEEADKAARYMASKCEKIGYLNMR